MNRAPQLGLAPSGWAPPDAPPAAEPCRKTAVGELPLLPPPVSNPDEFARILIRAICAAGVTDGVARLLYERCCRVLAFGGTVRAGFRHPGKSEAVEMIWRERPSLYHRFLAANDREAFLEALPWIGPATRRRLARDLGLVDPDQRAGDTRAAA